MKTKQNLTLSIADANTHLIQAELSLVLARESTLTLALPRWIPGSYLLRDFAKHIQQLSAITAEGEFIPLYRTSVSTWSLTAPAGEIRIRYQIYAFDQSVRACYVTSHYAFINPAASALYVMEWRDQPYQLNIQQPQTCPDNQQALWQVFTTLPPKQVNRSGFGRYFANHYDDLIEHPILIGKGIVIRWQSAGIDHQMVLVDEAPLEHIDIDKIAHDLQAICQRQHDFWGSPAPYAHYLFQVMVTADGYGGLEHTNSTALLTSRESLAYLDQSATQSYEDFLGLCSHEYFHAWMVKRIRPQALVRPNLQEAVITSLLWIFEGFTSLYDDWFLFRSERIGSQRLLERWGKTLSRALLTQGISTQSLADSSREAWIKYYQQTENSINSQVSYYTQGATIALALLAELVAKGKHLDDLLIQWWHSWQSNPQIGMKEDQLQSDLSLIAIGNWTSWIQRLIDTPYPDLANYIAAQLPELGLSLTTENAPQAGWKLTQKDNKLLVQQVLLNSAAQIAGIQVGDEIIALNQWRCNTIAQIETMLTRLAQQPTHPIKCLVARKGYVIELTFTLSISIMRYQLAFDDQDHPNLTWLKGNTQSEEASKHQETLALESQIKKHGEVTVSPSSSLTITTINKIETHHTEQPIIKTRNQRLREKRRMIHED